MDTSEALKDGRLDEAVASVKDAIRKSPSETKHRSVLFQLYCVQGNWEGAQTQLKVVSEMDIESSLWAGVCEKLLACEADRREVFGGKKLPTLFGKPPEWVAGMVEAFRLGLQGQWEAAAASQAQALEAAPATPVSVDGKEAEWIADADSRFGPILEAYVDGKYFWVPFEHIQEINLRARTHLMDAIWAPVDFEWTNQGKATGYVPLRYFGSETNADPQVRLGRKTEWEPKAENFYVGLGHRTFATSLDDVAMGEIKSLKFLHADQPLDFSNASPAAKPEGDEAPTGSV